MKKNNILIILFALIIILAGCTNQEQSHTESKSPPVVNQATNVSSDNDTAYDSTVEESEKIAEEFYGGEFNQAVCTTRPTPLADQIVKTVKGKGLGTYLATNPVFPRCATMNRMRWAGLEAEDFSLITTYETCSFCKPNPGCR